MLTSLSPSAEEYIKKLASLSPSDTLRCINAGCSLACLISSFSVSHDV